MAKHSFRRFPGQAWLSLAVGCWLLSVAPLAQAQDESSRKKVLELNQITGKDTMTEMARKLLAHPKETRKLLADAVIIAREPGKKGGPALNYNGAVILAQVAQETKQLVACEVFYRIAMAEAARLQSTSKLLDSYGGLIDAFYQNKKFGDSAKVCKELLDLNTDDGKERIVQVAVKGRDGDLQFEEFDKFDPAERLRPAVRRLYIQSLAKDGKYDRAVKLADDEIKKNDHWLIRQLKGAVLNEAGRYKEAVEVYEDVIDSVAKDDSLDEKDRNRYLEGYRYILSGIFLDMNKVDQATQLLQKLLEMKPDSPSYNNDLGFIWADHDMKLAEAEKLVRKALELDRKQRKETPDLDPEDDHDNGAYLDSLGWVLYKQKKYKEAKEVLLKAVEDKTTQHLEIYDHLGDVLLALDEREAAVAAWRKGLEMASDSRRDKERKALVEKKLEKNK